MKEPGVLMFEGRIICYDCSGERIDAIELGYPQLLPMTPELSRAIHEDLARGRRKADALHEEAEMVSRQERVAPIRLAAAAAPSRDESSRDESRDLHGIHARPVRRRA